MSPPDPSARLEGWEQIAQYLGVTKRNAQRWENLGLPIHREKRYKRDVVFAFKPEVDAWRKERHSPPDIIKAAAQPAPIPAVEVTDWWSTTRVNVLVGAGIGVVVVVLAFFYGRTDVPPPKPPVPVGRLLIRATSEGTTPERIQLRHNPYFLALSLDGKKLFATDRHSRTLSIVNLAKRTVRTLALPIDVASLAVSSRGFLYIGSAIEGIAVFDIAKERLQSATIPTGGSVLDMCPTPDGEKLFLAMERSGLKRLLTRTSKLDQISSQICPENLAMDGKGKNLYIAYQCSGPGGRRGHDSLEIFDVEKEASIGIISGPPMVGAPLSVSPDDKLVLVDGRDACSDQQYDHAGCPSVPTHVVHLIRAADRRILQTFGFHGDPQGFLDNSRFLIRSSFVSVVDDTRYVELERWDVKQEVYPAAVDHLGGRVYVGLPESNSIEVLEAEPPSCPPDTNGLAMFYPGDGTLEDAAGITALTGNGSVRFVPGRVGQAFFLDGNSHLSETWMSTYGFLYQDSTLSFYVKLASVDGEMTLLDWVRDEPRVGVRLLKSPDNHLVFESWPGGGLITSKTAVKPNVWYHVVVTKTDQETALYINGVMESRGGAPRRYYGIVKPLLLGARNLGKPAFHGWLDEIAFYGRALSAGEVRAMYRARETGPCKLP